MLNAGTSDAGEEGRFRLAMASSGIGMAIVDLEGRWLDVNPALEAIFGYPAEQIIGRQVDVFTHPDDLAISHTYLDDLASGRQAMLDAQKRYLRRDGSVLWAHVNVAAMPGIDGRPAYLIVQLRDISAQRDAERALQALNTTLEQRVAERTGDLAELARQQELFAYGVSHDLRGPIRAIDGFASLLDAHLDGRDDALARDYLQRIRGATARMGGLVDALLELSRAARVELKVAQVDISLLAEWSCAELVDAHPQREAAIDVQPGLMATGDERQLKRLLDQLMHNAWKFSAPRERVEITVRGEVTQGRLRLSVADRGIGFDMRYVDKLFEPFQRLHTSEQGGGDGIGLAIAQRIALRHGGRLWGASTVDAGSTFHLELPADQAPTPPR